MTSFGGGLFTGGLISPLCAVALRYQLAMWQEASSIAEKATSVGGIADATKVGAISAPIAPLQLQGGWAPLEAVAVWSKLLTVELVSELQL